MPIRRVVAAAARHASVVRWNGRASTDDGTLEERRYYCQSWRHDVVAMVTSGGALAERARYSAYGVAFGIPLGDVNGDGACDSTDVGLYTPTPSGVRYDLNLDGVVNSTDAGIASGAPSVTLGRGRLSNIGNRFGYAGYESDFATDLLMHVRNRVYHATLGRWTRRDPLGYVDGASLYQYVGSRPITGLDAMGLAGSSLGCVGGGGPGECPGGGNRGHGTGASSHISAGQHASILEWLLSWAEPMDCGDFDDSYPFPSWTTPGRVPSLPPEAPAALEQMVGPCSLEVFPLGMSGTDCYCWERRRIIEKHGSLTLLMVATCAGYALDVAGGLQNNDLCQNNYRHCLFSCCLRGKMDAAKARDILLMHECCYLHTNPSPNYEDVWRDLVWNRNGLKCWAPGLPSPTALPDITGQCGACCRVQLRSAGCNIPPSILQSR